MQGGDRSEYDQAAKLGTQKLARTQTYIHCTALETDAPGRAPSLRDPARQAPPRESGGGGRRGVQAAAPALRLQKVMPRFACARAAGAAHARSPCTCPRARIHGAKIFCRNTGSGNYTSNNNRNLASVGGASALLVR